MKIQNRALTVYPLLSENHTKTTSDRASKDGQYESDHQGGVVLLTDQLSGERLLVLIYSIGR